MPPIGESGSSSGGGEGRGEGQGDELGLRRPGISFSTFSSTGRIQRTIHYHYES